MAHHLFQMKRWRERQKSLASKGASGLSKDFKTPKTLSKDEKNCEKSRPASVNGRDTNSDKDPRARVGNSEVTFHLAKDSGAAQIYLAEVKPRRCEVDLDSQTTAQELADMLGLGPIERRDRTKPSRSKSSELADTSFKRPLEPKAMKDSRQVGAEIADTSVKISKKLLAAPTATKDSRHNGKPKNEKKAAAETKPSATKPGEVRINGGVTCSTVG